MTDFKVGDVIQTETGLRRVEWVFLEGTANVVEDNGTVDWCDAGRLAKSRLASKSDCDKFKARRLKMIADAIETNRAEIKSLEQEKEKGKRQIDFKVAGFSLGDVIKTKDGLARIVWFPSPTSAALQYIWCDPFVSDTEYLAECTLASEDECAQYEVGRTERIDVGIAYQCVEIKQYEKEAEEEKAR